MSNLWEISHDEKGLRGFVRTVGRDLEKRMKGKFKEIESHQMGVFFNVNNYPGSYFTLNFTYKGMQYRYLMGFSIKQEDSEKSQLIIDRFPGVGITSSNWANPTASPKELRTSAKMSEELDGFLKEKFGESIGERGNGCPLYETQLPEEYALQHATPQ